MDTEHLSGGEKDLQIDDHRTAHRSSQNSYNLVIVLINCAHCGRTIFDRKEAKSSVCFFNNLNKMNFYVILHAIIGASVVIARPVDVNNDDRPLINYISPHESNRLVRLL